MSRRVRKDNLAFLIFFLLVIGLLSVGFLVIGLGMLNDPTSGDSDDAALFVGIGVLGLISTVVNAVRYWPLDDKDGDRR